MGKMGTGAQVRTRLYLEGYHVDNALLNVQVTGAVGGPSTCQLNLVPTNTAKHIMPGTWVHVFVTDPWDSSPKGDLSDFKLLFEGVVVGRGFTREDDSRQLIVQCADPSIYWVSARQFWMNLAQGGGGLLNQFAIATSGGYGRFVALTDQPANGYFLSKLAGQQDNGEEKMLDTLVSLLDDVGNVNPFYTNVRNRFRITDRIIKSGAGKTDQLFSLSLLTDFMNGLVGRRSGQTNMAEIVNILLAPIYHDWVSVPAPPYLEDAEVFSRDSYGNIRKIPVKTRINAEKEISGEITLTSFEKARDTVIGSTIFKPQVYTITPPTCNVLFPNMYDHQSHSENFLIEPTRVSMTPQFPFLQDKAFSQLLLLRPTEIEIFRALTYELKRRPESAKWGDGGGQTAKLDSHDWTTNEERIRGIVYNFLNLPPAASGFTFTDQGKTAPEGTGKGIVKYLQNVASYEYFKSKYQSRATSVTGPLNLRPVPGFPMLILDDSDAEMNMVVYLGAITHSIDAKGAAQTSYDIKYPRLLSEVSYNQPIFEIAGGDGKSNLRRVATDEKGNFRFERLFDGQNKPAIPGWFGDSWSKVRPLSDTYRDFFGSNQFEDGGVAVPVTSVDKILFDEGAALVSDFLGNAKLPPSQEVIDHVLSVIKAGADSADVGAIDLLEVATFLNGKYQLARDTGREFDEVSRFTARPMAKIDQAFRFSGAAPQEVVENATLEEDARTRRVSYKDNSFDRFIGDDTAGSGYAGKPVTTEKGQEVGSSTRLPQMSGVFPNFDTQRNEAVTESLRNLGSGPSSEPRYDGRPLPYDFESSLYTESIVKAGVANKLFANDEIVDEDGNTRQGFFYDPTDPSFKGTEEDAKRIYAEQQKKLSEDAKKKKSSKPKEQAPTGAQLDETQRLPLTQPLSEKQVVELRRRVIEAYRDELRRQRGFTG